eukprot:3721909-Rhodomonas_salina.1
MLLRPCRDQLGYADTPRHIDSSRPALLTRRRIAAAPGPAPRRQRSPSQTARRGPDKAPTRSRPVPFRTPPVPAVRFGPRRDRRWPRPTWQSQVTGGGTEVGRKEPACAGTELGIGTELGRKLTNLVDTCQPGGRRAWRKGRKIAETPW